MIEYERHKTDDPDLTMVQDKVEIFADGLQSQGLLSGRLIKDIEFSASDVQRIYHRLERGYSGFIVVSINATATIQVDDGANTSPSQYIALKSSGTACTASLWIF